MRLYLIDGNSYIYRAFYAVKNLATSTGLPTNAIYGFTNMLLKFLREIRPEGLAVVFDSPGPTKRHRIYTEYKAQRPETPNSLVMQMPYIRKIVRAMNIPSIEIEGQEADDVIGSLARRAAEEGHEVFIVSADKDMLQLVDERIKIYDPLKDRIIDRKEVEKKLGIPPERVPEFMALTGDTIDNIPGIKGIGEKTAAELLRSRTLWDYIENPDLIPKARLKEALKRQKENLLLSYKLAKLDTSVDVPFQEEAFRLKEPEWPELVRLFKDLEFTSLLKVIPPKRLNVPVAKIKNTEELRKWLSHIEGTLYVRALIDRDGLFCLGLSDGKDYLVVDFQENKGLFELVSLRDVLEMIAESLKEGTQLVGFALKEFIKEMLGAG
ncbi:MAG: hypothetical protein D6778_09250, partial [Nitrospirae bacterium]